MTTRKNILNFVQCEFDRVAFTPTVDYKPTLGFKVTNNNLDTNDVFRVSSLKEAEDLVISFIPTALKGEIFINDIYNENKDLFLRVKVFLPI